MFCMQNPSFAIQACQVNVVMKKIFQKYAEILKK